MKRCKPCTLGNHSGTNGTRGCVRGDCTCACRASSSDLCVAVRVEMYGDEPAFSAAIVVDGQLTSFECPHAHNSRRTAALCAETLFASWREWCEPDARCELLHTYDDGRMLQELSRIVDGRRVTRRFTSHLPSGLLAYVPSSTGSWT